MITTPSVPLRYQYALEPLTDSTINALNKAFETASNGQVKNVLITYYPDLGYSDDLGHVNYCQTKIRYYDTQFKRDVCIHRIKTVALILITAIAVALSVYMMRKWIGDYSSQDPHTQVSALLCISATGVFGSLGIMGLIATIIKTIERAPKNKKREFQNYLARSQALISWITQYNTYQLYQRRAQLERVHQLFEDQLQEKETYAKQATEIQTLQKQLSNLIDPQPPTEPRPTLPPFPAEW